MMIERMRADTTTLLPRLRFLEFRKAEGWKPKTLGDVCRPQQWATISGSEIGDVGFPVYGANGFIGFYTAYNHEFETVAVTCRGSTCGEVLLIPEKSYITGNSMCLDGIDAARNSYHFVYHILKHRGFRDVISGSAQPQIVGNAIRKVKLAIPAIEEQQKIADCLTSLDEVITAQGRKVEALKTYKRGLIQQLFPREGETHPRRRFPEFRNAPEWKEVAIGDTGEVITGNTPATAQREYYGGDRHFVSPADISDLRFVETTKATLSEAGFAQGRKVRALSVLFVCIGSTIGKVAQNTQDCATNQQINAVVPSPTFSSDFIYYLLSLESVRIAKLAGKQAVPIINKTAFSAVDVMAPELKEQQRIADCLSSLDNQIAAESTQLAALKTHKQGLMQQLFPAPEGTAA